MTKTLIAALLAASTFAGAAQAGGMPTFADIVPVIKLPAPDSVYSTKTVTGGQ